MFFVIINNNNANFKPVRYNEQMSQVISKHTMLRELGGFGFVGCTCLFDRIWDKQMV